MDKNNSKKPWYKRVWVWIGIVVLVGMIGAAANGGTTDTSNSTVQTQETKEEQPAVEQPKEEAKPEKWDVEAVYAKINNGMTKAQVEEAIGKSSDSCSESENEYIGTTEFCTYGNAFIDKGTITVTYSNGEVSNKSKHNY